MSNAPRILNIILGIWLFVSAFLWMHSEAQFTNTWLVGAGITLFGLIALGAPAFRYVNTALAVWLFISVWALPILQTGTGWNNALVAIAVFVLSLIPSRPAAADRLDRTQNVGPRTPSRV